MKLTVVGCGDAFSSGGRFQSCYLLEAGRDRVMIDCGATTMLGLGRLGIDPNSIEKAVISHLHGDHFGGLVWWLLHALYPGRRTAPLDIWGPPGIEARFVAAAEALFPGCTAVERKFKLTFHEMHAGRAVRVGGVEVEAFEADHPSGAPSHGLRFAYGGKLLAFTGDSQWNESLVAGGRGADLYIMECYRFVGAPRSHTAWESIAGNLHRLDARRIMLTHMADDMLAHMREVTTQRVFPAEDALVVEI